MIQRLPIFPTRLPIGILIFWFSNLSGQTITQIHEFHAPAAHQAVAVDHQYFYAIGNRIIEKYDKQTGEFFLQWRDSSGIFKHLNSGVIIDGKLYCAHSNFPDIPMASSIEIFDPVSLKPIDSHSFGIDIGSATWIDRYAGYWYVAFAHYNRFKDHTGTDNRWTQLVKFSDQWEKLASWILPSDLLERFDDMSNSGGFIDGSGKIYITGHDYKEVYILEFPPHGYALQWIDTLQAPFEGQGIAADPGQEGIIFGIQRSSKKVVAGKIETGK